MDKTGRIAIGITLLLMSSYLLPVVYAANTSDDYGFDQSVTILNPQSYPVVGDNWTIYFNTHPYGKSVDRKDILQIGNHSFPDEVDFVALYRKDGDDWVLMDVNIDSDVIAADWNYEGGKAVFLAKTPGKHILEFRFGNDVEYAYNYAAAAHWWDSSWTYRMLINITENTGATLTNYQVPFTIDTYSFNYSKADSNGNDTRLTLYNPSSGVEEEIPYWIEYWNTSGESKVWINVTEIIASSTAMVYMYHGNSGASTGSDGNDTFYFFDDFSGSSLDTGKWDTSGSSGTYSITVSGGYVDLSTSTTSSGAAIKANNDATDGTINFISEMKGNITDSVNSGGNIRDRFYMENSIGSRSISAFDHGLFSQSSGPQPQIYWDAFTGTSVATTGELLIQHILDGTDVTWNVKYFDNGADIYTNSNAQTGLDYNRQYYGATRDASGTGTSNINIDWTRIRKYAYTDPTVNLGAEESQASWTDYFGGTVGIDSSTNVTVSDGDVEIENKTYFRIYDFTDNISNKAYEGTSASTSNEINDPYSYLTSDDNTYQVYSTGSSSYAYSRFEFNINEPVNDISSIYITWIGRGANGYFLDYDGYRLYVYDGSSWIEEASYTGTSKRTENIVYTSDISDYIDSSGYLKVLARSYDDGGFGSANIQTDYIDVNITYTGYKTQANITSIPITPEKLGGWDRFITNDTIPTGTNITYKILDVNNNSIMDVTSGQDISSITNSTIRLFANLTATNVSVTPELHDWNVKWTPFLSGIRWFDQNQSVNTVNRGNSIELRTRWTDPLALGNATLNRYVAGAWQNVSNVTLSGTDDWSNFTLTSELLSFDPSIISWRIFGNNSTGGWNFTDTMTFELHGWSNVTWESPSGGSSYLQGSIIPLNCRVVDVNTSSGISNYTVRFYWWNATTSNTSIGQNLTNSTGYAVFNWNTAGLDAANYFPKCNITNNSALYYDVTEESEVNISITISPDIENPEFYARGLSNDNLSWGDSTELSINITDNSYVNQAKFKIMYPNGTENNFTAFIKNGTRQAGFWNYTFNTIGEALGTYNWTFAYANDTVNNWNSTAIELKFNVSDTSAPIMGAPGFTDPLELGNQQNITIAILDASNLTVNISIEDLDGGTNKTMNGTKPNFWYAYTPSSTNKTVNFTIYATDDVSYQNSTSGSYMVSLYRNISINVNYSLIALPTLEQGLYAGSFGSGIPNVTKITRLNRVTKGYESCLYIPGIGWIGNNFSMEPGYGYWTYGSSNETSQRIGESMGTITSSLPTGWNLIGIKANATANATAIDIGSNCTQIVGNWNGTVYENTYVVGFGGDFNMTIGKGYWVEVTDNTTWIY